MKSLMNCNEIGTVILSSNFQVIGINTYARQVLGSTVTELGKSVYQYHSKTSHPKISHILNHTKSECSEMPTAMFVDVLNKVLMINVSKIDMWEGDSTQYAMNFIDVTEETGAEMNPDSGLMVLKNIPICYGGSFIFLKPNSIFFIKSDGNYCEIFTDDNSYFVHFTLKSIMKRCNTKYLFRVHKSYIINLERVKRIQKDEKGHAEILFDKESFPPVPIARRRMQELKDALQLKF